MFFRRKKQPASDQTVLTETLRSLQDLIDESEAVTPAENSEKSSESKETKPTTDQEPGDHPDHVAVEGATTVPADTPAPSDEAEPTSMVIGNDDIPVLTNVVYMPIPRSSATNKAANTSGLTEPAKRVISDKIMNSLETRLDNTGQSLDAELSKELRAAVTASLEDWSTRTQEILLKQIRQDSKEHNDGSEDENR